MTHDISKYCKAKVFNRIGKRTPIGVRFSTVGEPIAQVEQCIIILGPRGTLMKELMLTLETLVNWMSGPQNAI